MNTKAFIFNTLLLVLTYQLSFSQNTQSKGLELKPYAGISLPQGDFKEFSESGSVFGVAIDKYFGDRFALGFDINVQFNSFLNPFDFSGIPSSYNVTESNSGTWNATALTFGPTYKIGANKFSAEMYSKAGILYVKSPEYKATLNSTDFSKTIFDLPSQERTSFGLTSGVRFNYKVSNKLSLFINPQYVYSSAKVDYCDCGVEDAFVDGTFNPDNIIDNEPKLKSLNPSYFNLNAGVIFKVGGNSNSNPNRSPSICGISFAELECDASNMTLQLSQFWSNFNPNFTRVVEVYNGATLINPTTSSPQALSQNYGNIPFYTPINGNLIGVSLTAIIKIFDTNGNMVCTKDISFIVPQCSPPPISCDFVLDVENAICDGSKIVYNTTSSWANLNLGSIINFEAKDQFGNPVPMSVLPVLPITITAANTTGNASHSVRIPSSYDGVPISILMKITEPSTGFVKTCGLLDVFTPVCEPETSVCDMEYTITCDPKNKGIKINVTSSWSNMPAGSLLKYELFSLVNGTSVPFTSSPNNLPQPISLNGNSSHTLYINSSFSGIPMTFSMQIIDANGNVICQKGKDIKLPSCIYEKCELVEREASCNNEQPYMEFSVDWDNYTNFSNYSIYLDAKDESGSPVAWFNAAFPPFQLTSSSGSASFNMNLMSQYAGQTITITSKICETLSNGVKDCCYSKLEIKIPKCCEICSDLDVEHEPNPNQTFFQDFTVTGYVNSTTKITKVVAQLESISFSDRAGIVVPSNFEFRQGSYMNTVTSTLIGSLNNNRSNLLFQEFSPPTNTVNFNFLIDNYINKRVMHYKIKLTIFKIDGTYCERFVQYTR